MRSAGVRLVAQTGAWRGQPSRLASELAPLKVTIENNSDEPVKLRYEDFAMETGVGIEYSPLPPLNIQGTVIERSARPLFLPDYSIVPLFVYQGFWLAPWYAPYYVGLQPWHYPWAFSPAYCDIYYPRWTVELPTADMIRSAIPE